MVKKAQEDLMFELVKEVREDQKQMHKDVVEHTITFREHVKQDEKIYSELSEMRTHLGEINIVMEKNTQSLIQHIEGVIALKNLHIQNADRIAKLEEPNRVKEFLRSKVLFWTSLLAGVATCAAAIIKLIS